MKKPFHLLLFCFLYSLCFTQNEAAFWYFGQNAGLQFNIETGDVAAVTNGQLNTLEGCTTISDDDGNLLFYSDGRTVWDKNHQIMPNGDYFRGTGLLGDPSSTSSGVIVPNPFDSNLFYIFTVDEPHHDNASVFPNQFTGIYSDSGGNGTIPFADDGFNNGLSYSIVDMSLRDGLGDVISSEKNTQLITYDTNNPEHEKFKCSEKITAVRANDCSSMWVITHFVDTFYAFKIDENGVSKNAMGENVEPVKSTVGPVVPLQGYRRNALGYMKASPDGSKIVVAHSNFANTFGAGAPGGVYLFNFNAETGSVTNSIELLGPSANAFPYGVEFSSENNRVYASVNLATSSQILQWNLERDDIPNSLNIIHNSSIFSAGALQLGVDKNIYRAQINFDDFNSGRYLGIINDPGEISGAATYNETGVLLDINGNSQNLSRIGLPPFIQSLFNTQIDIIRNGESTSTLNLCKGDTYTLRADNIIGATYTWTKGGEPLSNTSFELQIDGSLPNAGGFYEVFIEPNNGECPFEGSAIVNIVDLPIANNATLTQCDMDGDGFTRFNLNEIYDAVTGGIPNLALDFFTQAPNDINASTIPLNASDYKNEPLPQIVTVRVTNPETGCVNFAAVTLDISPQITETFSLQTCDDDGIEDGIATFSLVNLKNEILNDAPLNSNLFFYETIENALLETPSTRINENNYETTSTTIYARIETDNSCLNLYEITLKVNNLPTLLPNTQAIYCLNTFPSTITLNSGLLNADPSNFSFVWSTENSNTSATIEVNTIGDYTVRATNLTTGCFKERTIKLIPSNIAIIENIEITDASDNNSISVLVTGEGDYEFALNNSNGPYQNSNTFEDLKGGIYTVYVKDKNGCGIISSEVSVISFPKFFTPNNDTINDYWQVQGITNTFQPNTIIYIFDKYGKLLKQLNPLSIGWDGTFNGKLLPNDDYWFKVTLQDGRIITRHFALRR